MVSLIVKRLFRPFHDMREIDEQSAQAGIGLENRPKEQSLPASDVGELAESGEGRSSSGERS